MLFPPSLSDNVLARAFRASNGEFGILPNDTDSFLTACEVYRVEVFGWELWLVDYNYDFEHGEPRQEPENTKEGHVLILTRKLGESINIGEDIIAKIFFFQAILYFNTFPSIL